MLLRAIFCSTLSGSSLQKQLTGKRTQNIPDLMGTNVGMGSVGRHEQRELEVLLTGTINLSGRGTLGLQGTWIRRPDPSANKKFGMTGQFSGGYLRVRDDGMESSLTGAKERKNAPVTYIRPRHSWRLF